MFSLNIKGLDITKKIISFDMYVKGLITVNLY